MTALDAPNHIPIFEYNMQPTMRGMPARKEITMTVNKAVMAMAGFMVLLSVLLTLYVSPNWIILTLFVGANLLQSAFTGFCPAAMIFRRMGLKSA